MRLREAGCRSKNCCRPEKWSAEMTAAPNGRLAALARPDFRRFFAGYATSALGTSMSSVAIAFAVLDEGGTATDLGIVFAAGIMPQVLFMLGGGVIADRSGRRPAMLDADAARCRSE